MRNSNLIWDEMCVSLSLSRSYSVAVTRDWVVGRCLANSSHIVLVPEDMTDPNCRVLDRIVMM